MLRRRFLFAKVVEEKPVYLYTYTTTDGQILDLKGVQNHKYENGVGSFETYNTNCKNFKDLATLESIIIPKGITSIGSSAFKNCNGLTSVEIPNSVTSIEDFAFEDCSGLTSITIPNSVTSIGRGAFWDCTGLTSVVIGNSVTSIGNRAFENCTRLKTVINFSNLIFSKNSSNNGYIAYYATKVINAPNAVIDGDFIWCNLNGTNTLSGYLGEVAELTLPNDYNGENYVIGNDAFYGCTDLTSIEIPSRVTSIGQLAFQNCSGLKEVHIKDLASWCNIDFADSYANPLYYAKNLYLNGENLTELIIPYGIVEIKDCTFYNCNNLTSVVIPNSVTSIGYSAFDGCIGLVSVEIGNSVTSIGISAFYNCSGLTSINIPNSVTNIGNNAFYECNGLTSVTIPNSVTNIDDQVFYNCSGLTSVEIGNSVTSIGKRAFYGCNGLESITIPNSVTSIGNYAFSYCTQLNEIISLNPISPEINRYTFNNIMENGVLKIPKGSDYNEWMKTDVYYLGYYNWTVEEI